VTTRRGSAAARGLPVAGVYDGVRTHVPVETVRDVAALARELEVDGLVGLGGGSAIDTCKAVVGHEGLNAKVIGVPTTYAGAEWTPFFGMLLRPGRKGGGGDEQARPVGAVYDPELTRGLPLAETVGTAMNALAHCAEAYYTPNRSDRGDRHADCGATAISYALPIVAREPGGIYGRTRLLEGAMRAAMAVGEAGLAFGHALAQAIGGHYGLPQGHMNAICLPAALRFNEPVVPEAVGRFSRALGTDDAASRLEELAVLGGFPLRLRDHGVPEDDLPGLAEAAAARPGTKANPRPVTAEDALPVLRSVW
jgi:maleylacetate reductase